ncbi:MAG: hypothetical protein ACYDDE_00605 [bacterium]
MGQYFTPVSIDKKEYIHGFDFNFGIKAWEWLYNFKETYTLGKIFLEQWNGTKISIIGDYNENLLTRVDIGKEYKNIGQQYFIEIKNITAEKMKADTKIRYLFIGENPNTELNHTYIKAEGLIQLGEIILINAIYSTGSGGGDFSFIPERFFPINKNYQFQRYTVIEELNKNMEYYDDTKDTLLDIKYEMDN